MGNSNPFEIILVITGIIIMIMGASAIVLSSIVSGVVMPAAPIFPQLNDLSGQGNLTANYAFSETHDITTANNQIIYGVFNPDKRVTLTFGTTLDEITVSRYGEWFIVPYWANEPFSYLDHILISKDILSVQTIANNFNGSMSEFIVDDGNAQYQCYIVFTPLTGYSNIVDSYNIGHGLTVFMYGDAFQAPGALEQAGAYFYFFGSIIAFFVLYAWYAVQIMGIAGTLLELSPVLTGGIAVLVIILFGGAMLMFIRGSSGNK